MKIEIKLFATLKKYLPPDADGSSATIEVKEWQDEIVFLHKVRAGAADRSYGIQVAKLAGLPPAVTARAREVLDMIERDHRHPARDLADELPLFSTGQPADAAVPAADPALERALEEINPDDMTPRQALEALYRLKSLLREAYEPK